MASKYHKQCYTMLYYVNKLIKNKKEVIYVWASFWACAKFIKIVKNLLPKITLKEITKVGQFFFIFHQMLQYDVTIEMLQNKCYFIDCLPNKKNYFCSYITIG